MSRLSRHDWPHDPPPRPRVGARGGRAGEGVRDPAGGAGAAAAAKGG